MNITRTIKNVTATIEPATRPSRLSISDTAFTSRSDTAASNTITITFSTEIDTFSITVYDPDFTGNLVEAYDKNNNLIQRVNVAGDSKPGVLTEVPVFIRGNNSLKYVKLIPAQGDYVIYDNLDINTTQPSAPTQTQTPAIVKSRRTNTFPIRVTVFPPNVARTFVYPININIVPEQTTEQELTLIYPFSINVLPVNVNISDPLIEKSYEFLKTAIENYVDEDRELKTLLNYGEDKQSVAVAYRYGLEDVNSIKTIQLKLLQPVPDDISVNSPVFLSREVAKSIIDKVRIRFAPEIDATPYLRPKNLKVNNNVDLGKTLNNVTLKFLALNTGSVGTIDDANNKTFEDQIFRRWYSYDFNSSELNIDFTDYKNFVFYGSAAMRLAAFKEKLNNLEQLEYKRIQFLSSSTYIGTTASAGYLFVQEESAKFSKEKEDIIRAFDRYEQYLYFTESGSSSPYTASAYYADTGMEYNPVGYWPKNSSGSVYATYSPEAIDWFESQSLIAQRYDEFNVNNLVNTVPTHIREHIDNDSYITFVTMVGHFFDNIKLYVDHFPYIHSRDLDPNFELSKDLVNEIAESVGFKLPTLNSTYDLTNNILGTEEDTPRRDLTAEIYKRLLHNLPFFAKAKGTKTALESFIKTFGITPQLVKVKETGVPFTSSYYSFDEFSTGLDYDDTKISYISLPLSASLRSPRTLQLTCTFAKSKPMTVLTGDNKWALNIVPHPSSSQLGRLELVSGSSSVLILSSSYQEIFGDELISVAIQTDASETSLHFMQTDGEDLLFNSIQSETTTFVPLWNATQFIYVGGSGSLVASRFDGTIDEIRLWKENLSDEVILNTAFDPGSNAGDTYASAAENLLVQLSFNNLNTNFLVASSSVLNESPYKDITVSPSLSQISVFNINASDFSRYNRNIRQEMAQAGSSGYLTNKVKVAPPPVFRESNSEVKTLYKNRSIVAPPQKKAQRGRNKVIVSLSPTEIINQNIIRNFGLENINSVLGSPTGLYRNFDKSLETLKRYYNQYYYVTLETNKFIRIMSEFGFVLNQIMDYFIPSKATAINGIVIEPNILEQVKIPPVKNVRFYGKGTKKTTNAAASLTGSGKPDYSATFNVSDDITVLTEETVNANYNSYRGQLDKSGTLETSGSYSTFKSNKIQTVTSISGSYTPLKSSISASVYNLIASQSTWKASIPTTITEITGSVLPLKSLINVNESTNSTSDYVVYDIQNQKNAITGSSVPKKVSRIDIGLSKVNKIKYNNKNHGSDGAEPYKRLYARKLFDTEINSRRLGGTASIYTPALYEIFPTADFRDPGVYTYFNKVEGVYYFKETAYAPVYRNELKQAWDSSTNTFVGAKTWSYGARYEYNEVVYQNIDATYTDLGELTGSVKPGNNYYYVFTTRPSYRPPDEKISFNSGSVPSYLPPSLDKENWQPVRYIPYETSVPKRVIFDTFTISDPSLNNFKTTTISIDKLIDIPIRYVDTFALSPIESNSSILGELILQNISVLFAIQSNLGGIRLRLYRSSEARGLDITRPQTVPPMGSHGVLLDMNLNSANVLELTAPIPALISGDIPENGKLYYIIDNLEPVSKPIISLSFYYFALQIEPKIPFGYLKKHYKFFRDNSTATKRSRYGGCKNTINTTIDGKEPIEIFISEGTTLRVGSTSPESGVTIGGGGVLEVT